MNWGDCSEKAGFLSVAAIALAGLVMSANMADANSNSGNGNGNSVPQQLSQLQQQLLSLQSTVASQGQEISNLKQGFTAMTTTQQGIEQAQTNIEQELHGIETTESGIESTERGIEDEQRGIEQKLSEFNQTLSSLQSQVTSLQGGSGSGAGSGSGSGQSTGYTVQGTMTDVNGHLFITPIHLVDENGNRYYVGYDSLGHFVFRNIPDGSYTIQFDMPGLQLAQPVSATVNGGDITNLQVQCAEAIHSISGMAQSNGQPLANKTVIINDQGGYYGGYWGYTDQNGGFSINGLPDGTYTILIGASPQNPSTTVLVSGNVTVSGADVEGVSIGN